jgi:transcriptional regulator with XRE-family HTH domain
MAYWRERRGLSQAALGDQMNMSWRTIQDIELGVRQADPRLSLIETAAAALQVPIEALLSDGPLPSRECVDDTEIAALSEVLHRPRAHYPAREPAEDPAKGVAYGWEAFQNAHYGTIGRFAPDLILDAAAAGGQDALTGAYQLASATMVKFGNRGDAMLAADRAMTEAEGAGPVAQASAARRYSDALTALGHHAAAVEGALTAADRLERDLRAYGATGWSVYGMLLLKACMGAAARGDAGTVRALLGSAGRIAAELPRDANEVWSAFNATNVKLYGVSAYVTLGDGGAAVSAATHISQDDLASLPRERRAHFMTDLAAGHALTGALDSALLVLLAAERLAPQEVHCRASTRELVTDLLRGARPMPETRLTALAGRCGVAL